jgi:hypothetical protein
VALILGVEAAVPLWGQHIGPLLEQLGMTQAISTAVQFWGDGLRWMMNALGCQ